MANHSGIVPTIKLLVGEGLAEEPEVNKAKMGVAGGLATATVIAESMIDPELALATETQTGRWPNVCQNDATHTWHITDWGDGYPDGNPPTQPNGVLDNGDWVECENIYTPPTTPPPTTAKPTTTTAKPTTTPPTTPRTTPPATNSTTTVEVVTTPATTVQESTTEQPTTTEAAPTTTNKVEDGSTTTLSPVDTAETSGASPTDKPTTTVHVSTASKDGSGGGVSGETLAMGGGFLIGAIILAALARRSHKHGHRPAIGKGI